MKRFVDCLKLYSYAAIILSLPALMASCSQGSTQDDKAFVVPERLKLWSSTAQAARVVGELKSGDQVTVIDRENAEDGESWSKVDGPNGELGWIRSLRSEERRVGKEGRGRWWPWA